MIKNWNCAQGIVRPAVSDWYALFALHNLLVQSHREVTVLTLVIPSLAPGAGAERSVCQEELAAWLKVFSLGENALVVVDVVLPAVLGLVLVWKAGVEASCHKLEGHGNALLIVRHDCGIA